MKFVFTLLALAIMHALVAQQKPGTVEFTTVNVVPHTAVKNQAATGTCWSFSTTSLIESESMRMGIGEMDLSEMFTVRNIYTEKAKNFILRQGIAQFSPGGLGHDVIFSISKYGAIPESVYSGLQLGTKGHNHQELDNKLKEYLNQVLSKRPIDENWMQGFQSILDDHLGKVPETFAYKEKQYTPQTFAKEVLKFNADDYLFITSFTHHPYYKPFILEIPDNYGSASYLNVPLDEMISMTKNAVSKGYSIMWDADVSNSNFRQKEGFALHLKDPTVKQISPEMEEDVYSQDVRQQLFENLTTQDDHLMHIVGLEKSPSGKNFFLVKNSWGEVGPYKGMIHVSENYFAINTITLVIPKQAVDTAILTKLNIK